MGARTLVEDEPRASVRHALGYNCQEKQRIERSEYGFASRVAFGFNADETHRVTRSSEYDSFQRQAFYPLVEWGWTRQTCLEYLRTVLGVDWQKSACVYCPFNRLREDAIERHRAHPIQVGAAMAMEHVSLALNPRAPLYKDRSLIQTALESRNASAIAEYRRLLAEHLWALYRVRRIYTAKGRADRAVERLAVFPDEAAARQALGRMEAERPSDHDHNGEFSYLWRQRREENVYPSREEFFTIAPATVATKARYGLAWFEQRWASLQLRLF